MTIEDLIAKIQSGNHARCLFHFTDDRNIPLIVEHGLLSRAELVRRDLLPRVICGGNEWSFEQDDRRGVSDDVHLSFFNDHPMLYHSKREGRISDPFIVKVLPEALLADGVRFCAGVANAANSNLFSVDDFEEYIDMEVLFTRTDWTNPDVYARLKAAKKYEILIPKQVALDHLRK